MFYENFRNLIDYKIKYLSENIHATLFVTPPPGLGKEGPQNDQF